MSERAIFDDASDAAVSGGTQPGATDKNITHIYLSCYYGFTGKCEMLQVVMLFPVEPKL
jgi:hypothetical protein